MGRSNITILVGTMTGTAEMVAQEVQTALEARWPSGHHPGDGRPRRQRLSGRRHLPDLHLDLRQGDVPDNAQALFSSLES